MNIDSKLQSRMGLRDLEQLFVVKLLIHLVIGVCLTIWVVKKDKKTRYHKLLLYLAIISCLLVGVGFVEIGLKGGFMLLMASQTG